MSAERTLLRRLVEWVDHRELFDTERPLQEFARDARALLAEPAPTAVEEVGPPPVIHEQPVILMTVYKALERERDLLVAELNRINATPRSRAEAEAMLDSYRKAVLDSIDFPWAKQDELNDRAALLAALTGEEK